MQAPPDNMGILICQRDPPSEIYKKKRCMNLYTVWAFKLDMGIQSNHCTVIHVYRKLLTPFKTNKWLHQQMESQECSIELKLYHVLNWYGNISACRPAELLRVDIAVSGFNQETIWLLYFPQRCQCNTGFFSLFTDHHPTQKTWCEQNKTPGHVQDKSLNIYRNNSPCYNLIVMAGSIQAWGPTSPHFLSLARTSTHWPKTFIQHIHDAFNAIKIDFILFLR